MFKLPTICSVIAMVCGAALAQTDIESVDFYCDDGAIEINAGEWDGTQDEASTDETMYGDPDYIVVDSTLDTTEDPTVYFGEDGESDTEEAWSDDEVLITDDQYFDLTDDQYLDFTDDQYVDLIGAVASDDWDYAIQPVPCVDSDYIGIVDYYTDEPIGDDDGELFTATVLSLDPVNFFHMEQMSALIPEPATLLLMSLGACWCCSRRRC